MFHRFTLRDADGQEHSYEVAAHNASEGVAVVSKLAAAVIDPMAGTALSVLVKTVPAAIKRGRGPDGKISLNNILDDGELLDKLGDLDFASSGPALRRAVESLDLELIREILKHAQRDGKDLSRSIVFDEAYQRNYGELFQAAWQAGQYNRFFGPLAGFGALAKSAMRQAATALSSGKRQKTE